MNKLLYLILTFLVFTGPLAAQQDAMYSQYMFNMLAINPAYAGSREVLSVTGLSRAQWIGMEGAPVTNTLCLDAPVKSKRIGIGLQLFNEKIGVTSSNGIYASYAYRVKFKKSTLAFGLQGGVLHYTANYTQVQLSRSSTQADQPFQGNGSILIPNIGTGIFLSDDQYYLGVSVPGILNTQKKSGSDIYLN
jgi:type IX secretion system PorP/SprF family membrane protein